MSLVLIWPDKVTEMFSALCHDPAAQQEKGLMQSSPSDPHCHRERLRRFLFYLSLEMTWEAHSPQSVWRSSNADLKSLHLIPQSLEIFKQQKPSCKTNSDKREIE